MEGTSPGTRTLRIDNEGGATLNWSASVEQSWLQINPLSGSVAGGDSQEIDVVPTLSGLPVGRYSTEIAFEANTAEPPSPVT
ncbi:MAG: hypothetical protein GWO04_14790, partial [Actinobacteria bacterium]|nr:hypothetical protein [Actinomycetota bacterium]